MVLSAGTTRCKSRTQILRLVPETVCSTLSKWPPWALSLSLVPRHTNGFTGYFLLIEHPTKYILLTLLSEWAVPTALSCSPHTHKGPRGWDTDTRSTSSQLPVPQHRLQTRQHHNSDCSHPTHHHPAKTKDILKFGRQSALGTAQAWITASGASSLHSSHRDS